MSQVPTDISEFLRGKRIAVAGVSRTKGVGNAIFKKLLSSGYEVFPINPKASQVEGVTCYPDVASIPGKVDGVVVTTHPDAAVEVARQCIENDVGVVWLHRSFGNGSVSEEAVRECETHGIKCIVGGCPLMFLDHVDLGHRCMRWWLQRRGRVPR